MLKVLKTDGLGALFEVRISFSVSGAGDSAPLQKWEKREGSVAVSKALAGVGHLNEDLQRCILHGRCSTRDTCV